MPMTTAEMLSPKNLFRDFVSGTVVFLVALPLCLGVAVASGLEDFPFAGVLAGIVGGLIVGAISGSHTSVSGPAAGLTAVVAAEIFALGNYEAFLVAVVMAGAIQILLGVLKAGFLAEFFPTSVIKGLLAAIGVILILKQIPHLFGHDADAEGDMSFFQMDNETTFTELWATVSDLHPGAIVVGVLSLMLLLGWQRWSVAKASGIPAALIVVVFGVLGTLVMRAVGGNWVIGVDHLVQVPVAESLSDFGNFFKYPDWSTLTNPRVYRSAITIALVASLETLLNLEAIDRLDPRKRVSPPNREMVAQGTGNIVSGLIGGLPVTSVIIRSSVNIQTRNVSKASTIIHGALLFGCVAIIPQTLNLIPLSCLAAILIVTGYKLASPDLFLQMWRRGRFQFLPFVVTVSAIVLTDLLIGILIGLGTAITFILYSNRRNPVRTFREKHVGGDVLRVELGNQVSFLNKAALMELLFGLKRGEHVLVDARSTAYLDPDVEDMLIDFDREAGPARGVEVSLLGFSKSRDLADKITFRDTSTSEVQKQVQPEDVIELLRAGNSRFRGGERLTRDFGRQKAMTADGQFPLAVILSCIDSRTPAELVFDLGLGDIFSVRIAGNIAHDKVMGSMEYGCAVAGAKLAVVMGHTRCGAVKSAVELFQANKTALEATGCEHIDTLTSEIQQSLERKEFDDPNLSGERLAQFMDEVSRRNVCHVVKSIQSRSQSLASLIDRHDIVLCGAMYDVKSGVVDFFDEDGRPLNPSQAEG